MEVNTHDRSEAVSGTPAGEPKTGCALEAGTVRRPGDWLEYTPDIETDEALRVAAERLGVPVARLAATTYDLCWWEES